jgi:hypothetical protein
MRRVKDEKPADSRRRNEGRRSYGVTKSKTKNMFQMLSKGDGDAQSVIAAALIARGRLDWLRFKSESLERLSGPRVVAA